MRVDIGCTDQLPEGCDLGVDIVPNQVLPPGKYIVADLNLRWPFGESTVDFFRAHDIIEHLHDKIHTMNEMWRCLKPDATVDIVVPTTDGPGAWQDPQHVSFWNRNSFKYFTHKCDYRDRFAKHYGIVAAFEVVKEKIEKTVDGPKLTILLKAIKEEPK